MASATASGRRIAVVEEAVEILLDALGGVAAEAFADYQIARELLVMVAFVEHRLQLGDHRGHRVEIDGRCC